jgi:hypothetical protein
MDTELFITKGNYSDDCPNIGVYVRNRKRLFKTSRRYLQSYNDFNTSYFPYPYGFFWGTHEYERVFTKEELNDD